MENKPGVIDAISAAFERTKNIMFRPMRYSVWWRFAVIGTLAGESAGGGGFNQGLNIPSRSRDHLGFMASPSTWWFDRVGPEVIALVIIVVCLLAVIFLFIASVMRFVLFDAVLRGRLGIRSGWTRWKTEGARFFLLHIVYSMFMLLSACGVLLIAVIPIFRHGGFELARLEWPELMLVIFGAVVFVVWMAILGTVWVLIKDFVVPMMALEGLAPMEAVRKVRHLVNRNFGGFAGYIGMKIVLAIGAGMLFGVIDFIIVFVCLIPLAIVGGILIGIGAAAGLTWHNPLAIVLAIAFGGIALGVIIYLVALVNAPAIVFFQSYVIHYLGPRYLPLEAVLNPPPPPAPPPPPTELSPAPA